jgi:hypothetical protein
MRIQIIPLIVALIHLTTFISAQEKYPKLIQNPFIGDKLDRIEEEYFQLFPGLPTFQEATFFLNQDNTITLNVKFYSGNRLIDSTLKINDSPSQLKERINKVILSDIRENKIQKLEFKSNEGLLNEGYVISFNEEQIRLIKEGFSNEEAEQDYKKNLSVVNVSDIKTVTVKESATALKFIFCFAGALAGGLIGIALAPEPTEPKTVLEAYASGAEASISSGITGVIGALVGVALGYVVGNAIKINVEYDILDAECQKILDRNCLHDAGLAINYTASLR